LRNILRSFPLFAKWMIVLSIACGKEVYKKNGEAMTGKRSCCNIPFPLLSYKDVL